ncbi:MAG TPA: ADP/ATP-dependent (S)-NAD(P)H-hydrate dehydratase, partial [Acidimicrobiales bacterium]|nr:ADP/ATP-dependent (S)-NAD(P)H-hydrate dehydratase [Acidimicrobiales bacterium]
LGIPGAALTELPSTEAVGVVLPEEGWAEDALAMTERCKALVVGPGLGRSPGTAGEVRRLVAGSKVPVVVDADGLFALGEAPHIGEVVSTLPRDVILTPHDGEFARLAGSAPATDRIASTRELSQVSKAIVLLKGPTTVVADSAGDVLLGTSGSPRLATAGSGDVLSGIIGAFCARGVHGAFAAGLGAHVHGRAASLGSDEGLVAGDLPDLTRKFLSGERRN